MARGHRGSRGRHHILISTSVALMPRQRNLLSVRYNGACAVCVFFCADLHQVPPQQCPHSSMERTLCVWTVVNDTHHNRSRGLNRPRHPGGFPQCHEKNMGGLYCMNNIPFTPYYVLSDTYLLTQCEHTPTAAQTVAKALLYATVCCICE